MHFKKTLVSSVAMISLTMAANPAMAQANDAEVNQLRAEVAALKAQLEQISAKVDATAQQQAETAEAVKAAKPAPEVKWKGAPELKGEDGWSFKPRGRIQYDVGYVGTPATITDPRTGFGNEARRIRLGASGSIPGGFGYKLEADFNEDEGVVLTDAVFNYKTGNLKINLGQHNPFQGLEELSSSNDTSFIERSAFTDAFGFERNVGISAEYKTGDVLLQGGIFTDNLTDLDDGNNESIGFDGRIVYAPKIGDTQLHFGANGHWRDLGQSVTQRSFRQRPLVHFTDIRPVDTGNITAASSETNYGLEAAVISGRFHAAAETHWLKLNRTGFADPTFFGGSIEAGVFLTDDTRAYKGGIFKNIKVKNPASKGGFGALQFNVRYDHLDLVDAGIVGGVQDSYQASLIWTPIDYVRFMVNYARLDYDQALGIIAGAPNNYGVDVIGGRFQLSF